MVWPLTSTILVRSLLLRGRNKTTQHSPLSGLPGQTSQESPGPNPTPARSGISGFVRWPSVHETHPDRIPLRPGPARLHRLAPPSHPSWRNYNSARLDGRHRRHGSSPPPPPPPIQPVANSTSARPGITASHRATDSGFQTKPLPTLLHTGQQTILEPGTFLFFLII